MSACASCGASILWVKLVPSARTTPLDEKPSTTGNVRMLGSRNVVARVLTKLYTSHFATCPHAAKHRKGKPKP